MKYFLLPAFALLLACGNSRNEATNDSTAAAASDSVVYAKADTLVCSEEQAITAISKLPEVMKQQQYLDSLTNHKGRIAYMTDSKDVDGVDCYMISCGYSGEQRWETYWIFYVDKQDCSKIRVEDTIEGTVISLDEWHKKEAE